MAEKAGAAVATGAATGRCTEGAPGRGRVALIDNIKGLLIILVVAGHMAHPVHNDNPVVSCAFDIIYLFHMPLFVFISGLLAKGAWHAGRLATRRIVSFFALGIAFQLALLTINGTADDPARWLRFSSAPWYIVSMGWWYLMTPVLARLGAGLGLAFAVAVSTILSMVDLSDGTLALARTAACAPRPAAPSSAPCPKSPSICAHRLPARAACATRDPSYKAEADSTTLEACLGAPR